MKAFNIPQSLLDKYNQPVPRYTSYPPANFFNSQFGERDLFNAISESNVSGTRNLSIYIHIPFCSQKCSYCGCNTHITRDINLIEEYVKALEKEIILISNKVDLSRPVSQIHFGGGSPNYVHINLIDRILSVIKNTFIFIDSPEIAIECHPAELSFQSIDNYVNMGFNRFSLGVQDFNNHILNAINRRIPSINVATLVDHIRNHKGVAVNLDLIYGLPLQTPENFAFTIDSALSVRPDRLVTFSYAHLPQINANQSELEKYQMPTVSAKTELLKYAYNKITSAGYTAIGLDHFALPQDELATALNSKVLHRNFQGYCTRRTTGQVLAFGASAISQLNTAYAQNTKDVKEYIEQISSGKIPVSRGYKLNPQEIVTREIINEIMCNLQLNWQQLAENLNMDIDQLNKISHVDPIKIKSLKEDNLIMENSNGYKVTDLGRFFVRNISAAFDSLNRDGKVYSSNV